MHTDILFDAASLVALAATCAHAQAANPADTGASVVSNEVIVTARKRPERLKDVPIAVTGITADTLQSNRILFHRIGTSSPTPAIPIRSARIICVGTAL